MGRHYQKVYENELKPKLSTANQGVYQHVIAFFMGILSPRISQPVIFLVFKVESNTIMNQ